MFDLLLGKCTHTRSKLSLSKIWGWAFKSSLYLEKLNSYGEFLIYLIIYNYGGHVGFRLLWINILLEILTVENVGIDTKTKYMQSLILKIFDRLYKHCDHVYRSITRLWTVFRLLGPIIVSRFAA